MAKATCSIIENGVLCGKPVKARGWCDQHYHRYRKYGDPLTVKVLRVNGSPDQRFWARVNKDGPIPEYAPELGPCWLWTGRTGRGDYGRFGASHGHHVQAHRFGYELQVGPIPDGLDLDHLCRVRLCVRASHLEPVTGRENIMRSPVAIAAVNAAKTHCIRNHPFDAANTYVRPDGARDCRICKYLQQQGLLWPVPSQSTLPGIA